ncbi:YcnI family protein [Gordonia jacobaea]|uniref:YcnI family copper-binding membrane protein n=1 Tax=Gordonia jacobaea TaxID=122202 RepID=UPI0022E7C86C|nr:YcnI family protein [Gordonia jacobaea]
MKRSARRLAFGLTALAFSLTTSVAGVAGAHVSVDPSSQPSSGGYGQVRLVVPSEEDDTTTTAISVTLPSGVDLSSVRTLPIPGWTATTEQAQSNGSERVSKITWQANTPESGLKPTEYGVFAFSGGRWPAGTTSVTLPTEQRYANGTVVSWNEQAADAQTEPEHPAPVVTLAPESGDHDAAHGAASTTDANSTVVQQQSPDGSTWWKVIAVASLVIAAAAVLAVAALWRRLGGNSSELDAPESSKASENSDSAETVAETDTAVHSGVGSKATADHR